MYITGAYDVILTVSVLYLSTLWLLLFCQVNCQFTLLGYEPFVLLQHLLFN